MGSCQSNTARLQPAHEPTALLDTGAGVIVRIQDPSNGDSKYQHNHRVGTAATSILHTTHDLKSPTADQQSVAVVKPGSHNQSLKSSIVYLKKPPRSCASSANRP